MLYWTGPRYGAELGQFWVIGDTPSWPHDASWSDKLSRYSQHDGWDPSSCGPPYGPAYMVPGGHDAEAMIPPKLGWRESAFKEDLCHDLMNEEITPGVTHTCYVWQEHATPMWDEWLDVGSCCSLAAEVLTLLPCAAAAAQIAEPTHDTCGFAAHCPLSCAEPLLAAKERCNSQLHHFDDDTSDAFSSVVPAELLTACQQTMDATLAAVPRTMTVDASASACLVESTAQSRTQLSAAIIICCP